MRKINYAAAGFFLLAAAFLVIPAAPAMAQAPALPPTACDPQYMDALESRAWLEAQREIAQNKNLITKPDSVFEYTCFADFLRSVASANLFSESGCGGSCGAGLGTSSLDSALGSVVGSTVSTYLQTYFNNSAGPNGNTGLAGKSLGAKVSQSLGSGPSQTCINMSSIWNEARCQDFADLPAYDGFYDFQWYAGNDPRRFPSACTPAATDTNQNMARAFNNNQSRYVLATENPNDATPYNTDPVVSNFAKILPIGATYGATTVSTCNPPIPTGIMVTRPNVTPYADGICSNPGCYLQVSGTTTSCVQ